jgi:methylated-DNA-[protein]-cysteine S-methyltransferase
MTRHTILQTAFGEVQLIGSDQGLQMLHLAGQKHFIEPPVDSVHDPHAPLFLSAQEQLDAYAAGELHTFELPISLTGSQSQLAVWAELQRIPYGETTTYGAIAKQIGKPGMAQSVGQHVGRNPISIVVPCHRVIGANGSLTGYAGGLERKRQLLQLEGALQAELL